VFYLKEMHHKIPDILAPIHSISSLLHFDRTPLEKLGMTLLNPSLTTIILVVTRLFRVICLENIARGERFDRGLEVFEARYRSILRFFHALFVNKHNGK